MRGTYAIILFAACGPSLKEPPGGVNDAPSGSHDAETYFDAAIDSSCGAQMQNIGVVNLGDPPDLLVVLDRSGSMTSPPPVFPPIFDSKWSIMRNALNAITTQKDMQIKFGLLEFPSDEVCASDATPEVGIALGTHNAFASYLASRSPGGTSSPSTSRQARCR